MKAIFSLIFTLLTSFSFGEPKDIISSTGKINFELYSCCYTEKKTEVCTTCEDTYIILDNPVTYNKQTYAKLKIENDDYQNKIYDLYDKKVKISGEILSSQNDILIIKLISLSSD